MTINRPSRVPLLDVCDFIDLDINSSIDVNVFDKICEVHIIDCIRNIIRFL